MEEKKGKIKLILLLFLFFVFILAIIIMAFVIYNQHNENVSKTIEVNNLKTQISDQNKTIADLKKQLEEINKAANSNNIEKGTYIATEEKFDSAGVSYKDCSVTFTNNNLCSIYEGFGCSYLGAYSIDNNTLTCNTLIRRRESGGIVYKEANIIFQFEIINSNELKLLKITNNSETDFDSPGLQEGMEYKLNPESNIIVLLND